MQQFTGGRCVRKHHAGSPCACYGCGTAVYPEPLDVDIDPDDPKLRLSRGYAEMAVVEDKRTHRLRLQARLYCPACASPAIVHQNERAVSDTARRTSASPPTVSPPDHDAQRRPYL